MFPTVVSGRLRRATRSRDSIRNTRTLTQTRRTQGRGRTFETLESVNPRRHCSTSVSKSTRRAWLRGSVPGTEYFDGDVVCRLDLVLVVVGLPASETSLYTPRIGG